MSSSHPYHRRSRPGPYHVIRNCNVDAHEEGIFDDRHVDLRYVHLEPYGELNTVAEAVRRFDARTAEFVRASAGNIPKIQFSPAPNAESLLALNKYKDRD